MGGRNPIPASGVPYKPPALTVESVEPRLSNTFVFTSMRIPYRFRSLYRLHLQINSPVLTIMKLATIRSDGRVKALLITNP